VRFAVERWLDFYWDARWLFPLNYEELALNKDKITLDVNADKFKELDEKEILHIVAARTDGKVVGYHISALVPHMHYESAGLMAYTDVYFLHPDYRRGGTGAKMLMEVERTLRQRGIRKFYMSTKAHMDHSAMLAAMGYKFTDRIFTKVL
jgi:L-amino acid N-acyltransferase YncA